MHFRAGDGSMFNAPRHNQELPLLQRDLAIAKLHHEVALDDEKELVFKVVLVPDEVALELDEFDVLAIELPDDPWPPMVVNEGQLVLHVDFIQEQILHDTAEGDS